MHIGFDISQTGSGKAGCGYFAHAMIRQMLEICPGHRYSLFPSFGDFYFDPHIPRRNPYRGQNVNYGPLYISRDTAALFWSSLNLEIAIGSPDVLHANNFWCPTQLVSTKLVYTLYDLNFLVEPSWTTESNRVGCFEGVFRSAIAADWVVAISKASQADYLKMFPHFPEKRVRVIYPCSRFTDSKLKGKPPKGLEHILADGYWLSVGTIEPRKNQRRLAEAYARYLALGGTPIPLVFVGGKGWLMEDFQSHLRDLGITAHIVMPGKVSDDELIWLYRNCYANLYPSLFEGFGLPVLEGMQFGAPTLASQSTSIPEITGKAAILLNPEDIENWAQTMLRLVSNKVERDKLSVAALEQAEKFDCKHSAIELLQLYKEALISPKRHSQ